MVIVVTVQTDLRIYCANLCENVVAAVSAPRRRRLIMGGCSNSSAEGRTVTYSFCLEKERVDKYNCNQYNYSITG